MRIYIYHITTKGREAIRQAYEKYSTPKYKLHALRGGLTYRLDNGNFIAVTHGPVHKIPDFVANKFPEFKSQLKEQRQKGFDEIKADLEERGAKENIDYRMVFE